MRGILSFASGSASSLYGCIGYAVSEYIQRRLPEGFFKYTAISSELATRNIRRTFHKTNSGVEIFKREKPELILQPTVSDVDPDGPMQNIPLTTNFDNLQNFINKQDLFQVIKDKKFGYDLHFKMNRDQIVYEVTIRVATDHQQKDLYKVLYNQFIWNRPMYQRMALEAVIPKSLIAQMSKLCNMDIEEHEEYIPMVLHRLNTCSAYPITYKIRNASATDEWFMYYPHNVVLTFSNLQKDSGTRKGMSEDVYPITFQVTADFNLPGVFFIDGNLDTVKQIDISLKTSSYSNPDVADYIPLYTVNNLYTRFPPEVDGMQLYGTSIFKTDEQPGQMEDRVNLSDVIDREYVRVIRLHKSWRMNPDSLLKVYVLKNKVLLEYEKDYLIDWTRLELIVKNPDKTSTYRILLYFNYATANEILNNTEYRNVYDMDKLKKNEFPGPANQQDGVYFSSPSQENPSALEKADHIYPTRHDIPEDEKDVSQYIRPSEPHISTIPPEYVLEKDKVYFSEKEDPGRVLTESTSLYTEGNMPKEKVGDPEYAESVIGPDDHKYEHPIETDIDDIKTEIVVPIPPIFPPRPPEPPKFEMVDDGTVGNTFNSVNVDPVKDQQIKEMMKPSPMEEVMKIMQPSVVEEKKEENTSTNSFGKKKKKYHSEAKK